MAWDDTKVTSNTLTAAEWNAMVTDQKTRITDVVTDTTPQLGGNLDANGKNIEGVTPTEMGYLSGISSAVQTQLTAKIEDVVDDTTPQLGGHIDLNSKGITIEGTAGTNLVNGDYVYLAVADGKWEKVDADAEATSVGLLGVATETINENASGTILVHGVYTTSGLTAGDTYYLSTTLGGITTTAPSGTGDIVRIIGYALSTTLLFINQDNTYIEVA